MKKITLIFLLIMMIAAQVWAAEKDITSRDAKSLLERNKTVFLLDVRTPQEYSQARLSGSVLIPISELERRIDEIPKDKAILVYCAVGSRSRSAAAFLSKHGYKQVFNMNDGIVGWYRNGFPVQR